jgi:hypothetical protein
MHSAILIQNAIKRQAASTKKLPTPISQFKMFLNREAKASPEEKDESQPTPPDGETQEETTPPPENPDNGEPTGGQEGETADTPETPDTPEDGDTPEAEADGETQDASEGGAGETLPEAPETPQGVAEDAPTKKAGKQSGKRRGK